MSVVTSIHVTEDISLITFDDLPTRLSVISDIFNQFAKAGINIDMISQTAPHSSQVSVSFSMSDGEFVKVLEIVNAYRKEHASIKTMISSGNCKIQLYGEEMRHVPGVAARAIAAVSGSGAEITLITTSEVDISLLVPEAALEAALAALEAEFSVKASI